MKLPCDTKRVYYAMEEEIFYYDIEREIIQHLYKETLKFY